MRQEPKDKNTQIVKIDPDTLPEATETEAPPEAAAPTQYSVKVIVNGELLIEREVPILKRATTMKSVRQHIRNRALSITQAQVTDVVTPDGIFAKTITFDGVEMSVKPVSVKGKSAATTTKDWSAEIAEVMGIVHDGDVKADDKEAELLKYNRHALIAAAKAEGANGLKPRSTKKQAVAALLGS